MERCPSKPGRKVAFSSATWERGKIEIPPSPPFPKGGTIRINLKNLEVFRLQGYESVSWPSPR